MADQRQKNLRRLYAHCRAFFFNRKFQKDFCPALTGGEVINTI